MKPPPKPYRVIILGAGFSRPAGLPLASELWREIREIAAHFNADRRASKFNDDLKTYGEYLRDCEGDDVEINFERFMHFLDIEHFLRLRGGDTWADEGNEGTIVTKTLIGHILADCEARLAGIPDLYLEFARRLEPDDYVVTFNYDTLLERALEAVGKPFRLFPARYKEIHEYSGTVDNDRDEVVVLKMHGSIDWFDRKNYERRSRLNARLGAEPPRDLIFSHVDELGVVPLTDGPRFEGDPMRTIYRVRHLKALYDKPLMFLVTPAMLPPSSAKIVYANQVGDMWDGFNGVGIFNFGMAIVGFSLAPQDEYARQIVYRLIKNYQQSTWIEKEFERTKSPLVLVNFFPSADAERDFRERYRFVNWDKARLFGDGFDTASMAAIFE